MDKLCLFLLLCLAGCHSHPPHEAHDHAAEEPHDHAAEESHDHAAQEAHGHGSSEEVGSTQITLWDQEVELFIEHPFFVVGEPTRFVTHVTHLDGWLPRTEGEIQVILSKQGEPSIEIRDETPARSGIYIPTLEFPKAGTWDIEVRVPLEHTISSQTISDVTVFASVHDAQHQPSPAEADGISFLKEQQWVLPFASEEVTEQPFRASLEANGMVKPRAGGEVVVHAPVGGRLQAGVSPLPHFGAVVQKGEKLGTILPRLGRDEDGAVLGLALQRAELAHDFATNELARIKSLFEKEAISHNRVKIAELDLNNKQAELKTARARLKQFSDVEKQGGGPSSAQVGVYAPLSGTIIEANVVPGAFLTEGARMFRIIDLDNVWLDVQIPESEIGRVAGAQGAWFTVEGLDQVFEVNLETGGRLVALGGEIDPRRRTVPLVFELPNPQGLLRIGMFAQVSVFTGQRATGASIPASALIDEGGVTVAYVHVGGETFERRVLSLGLRDGARFQVVSGIAPGERVVSKGAYQIRLAATSTTLPAHGHAH